MHLHQDDRDLIMSLVGSVQALTSSVGQLVAMVGELVAQGASEPEPEPTGGTGALDDD